MIENAVFYFFFTQLHFSQSHSFMHIFLYEFAQMHMYISDSVYMKHHDHESCMSHGYKYCVWVCGYVGAWCAWLNSRAEGGDTSLV